MEAQQFPEVISEIERFCVNHNNPTRAVFLFCYRDLNLKLFLATPACEACADIVEKKIKYRQVAGLEKFRIVHQITKDISKLLKNSKR